MLMKNWFILFTLFLITITAEARKPAVEPITSLSIDSAPEVIPRKEMFYNFRSNNKSTVARVYTRKDLLSGRAPSLESNELSATMGFMFLCALLLLPLLTRYVAMNTYLQKDQKETATKESPDAEVIPLAGHKKKIQSVDEKEKKKYKKAG